ncbi:DUF5617 domain-containing protein [Legionella worsleiensis]|uniref:Substrate of the Dot/Icm secretion system n=1 Tax=Legionella worsleiensis TaxID=45076 RepID=A0A0W1A9D2_9GAMM|nr:DUF5617 domain-containing protein [Legionella worsleiensis]KTD77933.1 substrate of the Dot/Icm secretion system [Legionella worsleiensis]STY31645.1 Dot/Icm secretion system substrate [Legionella worsleiensis]
MMPVYSLYQTKKEFSLERIETEEFYHFFGDEKAGPRWFVRADQNRHIVHDESLITYRMVYLALDRNPENLARALEAIKTNFQFQTYLAENGLGLQVHKTEEKAFEVTNGTYKGLPWNQVGQEIKIIVPIFKQIKPLELKECMLTLLKILVDAGVKTALPPATITYKPQQDGHLDAPRNTVYEIEMGLMEAKQLAYFKESGSHREIRHRQDAFFLVSANQFLSEKEITLPFSYMVSYMQLRHEMGISSEGIPTHVIELANQSDDIFNLGKEIQFSRADLRKAKISDSLFLSTAQINAALAASNIDFDDLINMLKTEITTTLTEAASSIAVNSSLTEAENPAHDLEPMITEFFTKGSLISYVGSKVPVSLFAPLQVTHRVGCLKADVAQNLAALAKFGKSFKILPADYHNELVFEAELRTRFEPLLALVGELYKINPDKAVAWFNTLSHIKNRFLNIQALKISQFQLPAPQEQNSSMATITADHEAVSVASPAEASVPTAEKKPVFPASYKGIWNAEGRRSDLAQAKNLLRDYVKGGFWGRLFTCHLGRHHTRAVEQVLQRNDLLNVQQLVNAVIAELKKTEGVTLNPEGSLARRLDFIAQEAKVIIPPLQAAPQPEESSQTAPQASM